MVLRFAGFALDRPRAELRGPDGEVLKLRPKTFSMLTLFATNAGRVLSKQALMDAVWPNVHVGDDSLFQCIREIRTVLGDDQRQLIRLVSGRGYLFEAEVSVEPATTDILLPLPVAAAPAAQRYRWLQHRGGCLARAAAWRSPSPASAPSSGWPSSRRSSGRASSSDEGLRPLR